MENGSLYCRGNYSGTPKKIFNLGDHIVKFSYGYGHMLILRDDGQVFPLSDGSVGQGESGKEYEDGYLHLVNHYRARSVAK